MKTTDQAITTQSNLAIQRLTALWAFSESALGGVLHALQVPFTGLIVGGFAIIILTLIAWFAQGDLKKIFTSLLIVLIIKATVSPYTPLPAYIAVSFQGLMAFLLFRLMGINYISILLLSVITLFESALQKLLILTFFFGQSIWTAADKIVGSIAGQLKMQTNNGSLLIIGVYLLIHFITGILLSFFIYRLVKTISTRKISEEMPAITGISPELMIKKKKRKNRGAIIMIGLLIVISVILFVFARDTKQGLTAVARSVAWTLLAMLSWYSLSPYLLKGIRKFLSKKESTVANHVSDILAVFPVLNQLVFAAWKKSAEQKNIRRLPFFISTIINWTLISPGIENNNPTRK